MKNGLKNQKWPTSGRIGYTTPPRPGGPQRFHIGGQHQKWSTSGQIGYVTVPSGGSPTFLKRGANGEVAPKLPDWLCNACKRRPPPASKRRTKFEMAYKWGPWLRNYYCLWGGQNHKSSKKWADCTHNPAVPKVSKRGTTSALAHNWADGLCNPCHRGVPNVLERGPSLP